MPRAALAAIAALAALALGGCGLGAGSSPTGTRLTVTRDFGSHPVLDVAHPRLGGADTVLRLLERNARVTTRFGGGFVQSVDGVAGGRPGDRPVDWFYYVNGVEAPKGAAATRVHSGDRVWWDRHDWGAAMRVPAVVGSFPEPFLHGRDGKRLPVRVECALPGSPPCTAVVRHLTAVGVLAAQGGLQASLTMHTLRVLVGPWPALREDDAAAQLEHGPAASGVYARVARDGRSIAVLDEQGRTVRVLRSDSGLVAAARFQDGQPVWIVTGTDDRGLLDAANALDESVLDDRFALATAADQGIPLPEVRP